MALVGILSTHAINSKSGVDWALSRSPSETDTMLQIIIISAALTDYRLIVVSCTTIIVKTTPCQIQVEKWKPPFEIMNSSQKLPYSALGIAPLNDLFEVTLSRPAQ